MWEYVKKSLALGLGAAMLTSEKLKQLADDAVARGEMSKEEARSFIDDVTHRAEEEKRNLQTWMREQVSRMMAELGVAERERLDSLERRLNAMELRLEAAETAGYEQEEIT